MGDIFKRPAFIIIFAVALCGALVWSYIDKRQQQQAATQNQTTTETPIIVNLTNVDSTDFDSIIKDDLDLANSKAIAANAQNKLAAIEYELPGDLRPNAGTSRYIYTADNDTGNNWMVTISQSSKNYVRALVPKTDYLGVMQVLNTGLWKFNYVTALQIAEKNGGQDFRDNNTIQNTKLTLMHMPPKNWLEWTVVYQGNNTSLIKIIDANSGQIIDNTTKSTTSTSQ